MNVYSITCHRNTQKLSLGSCDIFPKELNQIFNKTMPKKMTKEEFIAKAEKESTIMMKLIIKEIKSK